MRPEPRRPGLRAAAPRRYEQMLAARNALLRLVAARRISVRELAECWQCSVRVAQQRLDGDLPLHVGEVLSLPDRAALELLDEVRLVVLQRRAA